MRELLSDQTVLVVGGSTARCSHCVRDYKKHMPFFCMQAGHSCQ